MKSSLFPVPGFSCQWPYRRWIPEKCFNPRGHQGRLYWNHGRLANDTACYERRRTPHRSGMPRQKIQRQLSLKWSDGCDVFAHQSLESLFCWFIWLVQIFAPSKQANHMLPSPPVFPLCCLDAGVPVYLYEFVYRADIHKQTRPSFVRADHADDVGFMLGGCFWDGPLKIIGRVPMFCYSYICCFIFILLIWMF